MKITPKMQQGGSLESFFSVYTSPQQQQVVQKQQKSGSSKNSSDGELTEKDFFNMLKDIKGLPNETTAVINKFMSTFKMQNLTGISTGDLNTQYLSALNMLVRLKDNKETYDEVMKKADTKGAINEPIITQKGNVIIQNQSTGKLSEVSLEQYLNNKDDYTLMTVSNLADLRKYEPSFVFYNDIFPLIQSSTGYDEFISEINKANQSLSGTKYTESAPTNKQALAGLQSLSKMSEQDRNKVINAALDGVYDVTSEVYSNEVQINELLNFLCTALPDRLKTWAALKVDNPDKEKATRQLIGMYLKRELKNYITYNVDYKGSEEKLTGKGSSSDEPNKGDWGQIQTDQGGEPTTLTILNNKTLMRTNGNFYGTVPGLNKSKSLEEFIADGNMGRMIKSRKNITFGNLQISNGSYKDVVVDANTGAYTATLPIDVDGKVNYKVLEEYTKAQEDVLNKGIKINSPEFDKEVAKQLVSQGLGYLVNTSSQTLDKSKFGHFLVLQGYTSDKANVVINNKSASIDSGKSPYIIDSSSDGEVYDVIKRALSTKNSQYDIDDPDWADFGYFYDHVYSSNIFIPLNDNYVNAFSADKNKITVDESKSYDEEAQVMDKLDSLRRTDSSQMYEAE